MFWKHVKLALNIFEPIVKVLRRADSDTLSMGWLYGDLVACKEEIALNLKNNERKTKPISMLLDKRWNDKLKSNLHMAGHLLNPFYYYQQREVIDGDGAFADGFTECMFRMYMNDTDMQDKISSQLPLYQNQSGSFGREVAQRQSRNPSLDPVNWWQLHGGTAPDLKKMAMRVLGLTTSSSGCERNWSIFEMIHTKKRNRLSPDKLKDLVYVKFNAQLKERFASRNNDPLAARSMADGKVAEWVEPPKTTNTPREESDDEDDEVFPGERLTWRQVELAMGADPTSRASTRLRTSRKRKAVASSSRDKGKGKKRMVEEEDLESSDISTSSDSSSDDSVSETEEGQEMD